ncbi:hypothetical protein BG454_07135 [Roseinatronobacter bogoriensis subsp. barguzinensis]|uniref:Uncharacterized protein n=1 Tax=Roseinatronobacter bogoriensis subsp. barguzinensis TaxID=441209 RepID=A0A2K8KCH5_9RHOB|nr:hypothetical protein BG454_07135 [Rhodobaca barguzinensis]
MGYSHRAGRDAVFVRLADAGLSARVWRQAMPSVGVCLQRFGTLGQNKSETRDTIASGTSIDS